MCRVINPLSKYTMTQNKYKQRLHIGHVDQIDVDYKKKVT